MSNRPFIYNITSPKSKKLKLCLHPKYPDLALVPDCGFSCIEVYGKCMEKHTKTWHIDVVWPLIRKCLQKMKGYTPERRLRTDVFIVPRVVSEPPVRSVSSAIFGRTCPVRSHYQRPCPSFGEGKKIWSELYSFVYRKRVFVRNIRKILLPLTPTCWHHSHQSETLDVMTLPSF